MQSQTLKLFRLRDLKLDFPVLIDDFFIKYYHFNILLLRIAHTH